MNNIERGEHLYGVMFWAQWFAFIVPRYEVFQYVGYSPDNGHHYFRSKKNPNAIIGKNVYQIAASGSFRPFLIDRDRFNKEVVSKCPSLT